MSVINQLRERREALGMPLEVIPKRAGISASSANRVLCKPTRTFFPGQQSKRKPPNFSLETIEALCKALGLKLTVVEDVSISEMRRQRVIEKCGGEPTPELMRKLANSEFVWIK